MGRGRAKAKQTKVARELKYRSINTDFTSLERELRGGSAIDDDFIDDVDQDDDMPDPYADLAARYETLDDDDDDDFGDLRRSG